MMVLVNVLVVLGFDAFSCCSFTIITSVFSSGVLDMDAFITGISLMSLVLDENMFFVFMC